MGVFRARSLRAVLAGSLLFGGVALALVMPAHGTGATTQLVTTNVVTSGGNSYCALLTSGGVDCWGSNATGELGTGPQPIVTSRLPWSVWVGPGHFLEWPA